MCKILSGRVGGGVLAAFSHQRAIRTSLEKQLDQGGPIASRGESVPDFLRNPMATCDFPEGEGGSDPQ